MGQFFGISAFVPKYQFFALVTFVQPNFTESYPIKIAESDPLQFFIWVRIVAEPTIYYKRVPSLKSKL